jgi:hypothetical protein
MLVPHGMLDTTPVCMTARYIQNKNIIHINYNYYVDGILLSSS